MPRMSTAHRAPRDQSPDPVGLLLGEFGDDAFDPLERFATENIGNLEQLADACRRLASRVRTSEHAEKALRLTPQGELALRHRREHGISPREWEALVRCARIANDLDIDLGLSDAPPALPTPVLAGSYPQEELARRYLAALARWCDEETTEDEPEGNPGGRAGHPDAVRVGKRRPANKVVPPKPKRKTPAEIGDGGEGGAAVPPDSGDVEAVTRISPKTKPARDPGQPGEDRLADILTALRLAGMPLTGEEIRKKMGMKTKGKLPANLSWAVRNGHLVSGKMGYSIPDCSTSADSPAGRGM